MKPRPLHPVDEALEARIDEARDDFMLAESISDRKRTWARLQALLAARSPQRVLEMERAYGFR